MRFLKESFVFLKEVEGLIVLKKVNNNVAICRDGNNRELVAFGKGIGFPSMPYELTDLSKIDRTFYDVGQQYVGILCDIPEKVLLFTARMIDEIRPNLPYETSPNIILTLSDHIAFAIERYKNGVYVQMPSVYQLEQNYPLEINIGRRFVSEIYRVLKVRLPKGEVQGIAMQFINARNGMDSSGLGQQWLHQEKVDTLLEEATKIVEQELNMTIGRGSFTYARFATHTEYLLQRLAKHEHIDSNNLQMYITTREQYPRIADCVDKIGDYFNDELGISPTEEEKLYLILHVNRVCAKEKE